MYSTHWVLFMPQSPLGGCDFPEGKLFALIFSAAPSSASCLGDGGYLVRILCPFIPSFLHLFWLQRYFHSFHHR